MSPEEVDTASRILLRAIINLATYIAGLLVTLYCCDQYHVFERLALLWR